MAANGADWAAAEVLPSKDTDAGLGLTATSSLRHNMSHPWLGRRVGSLLLRGPAHQTVTVATVPLNLALTAESARQDPQLGSSYAELMELGLLDDRSVVIVMLLVEKMRGQGSRYAPYIQLLPESFSTPLWFDEQQLLELAGTTLAAATAARQASLARTWQRLQPAVSSMLQQVGVFDVPTLEDFKWATSIFWSRGLGLPVPVMQQQQQQQQDVAPGSSSSVRIETLEGLVPGLDFANHSQQPRCWWEVVEQQQQQLRQQQQQQQADADAGAGEGSAEPAAAAAAAAVGEAGPSYAVQLVTNRVCCPKAGEELTISYGDKGNEELLLLYGFALPANPHEQLMLLCPLPPPEEWDELFTARMQLLQARGLTPQLFLSASHLANHQQAAAAARSSSSSARRRCSIIPAAAREVIEVFVMQKQELLVELQAAEALQQGSPASTLSSSSSSSSGQSNGQNDVESIVNDEIQARIEALGLSMAVLTTFVRLLELKLIQMEGEEGTGPLEDDLRLLQEADSAQQAHKAHAAAAAEMPSWLRHCLLYRSGQKQLVRQYLKAGRRELQDTLAELQALMEVTGEYQE
ncbi:hypothetical protein OEZ85_004272 [Tetradesmus obliquus]|uniref:SET domain-containing protein n=1 Tax=Tetradesmus obliquus TaxID=3088 RepID=A0ABY8UQN7_TETOB|nr:hypothetical protein OEZ85_004272 [Tetradesmus obliquus]